MTVLSMDRYLESYSVDFALMHSQAPTKSDVHLCIFCRIENNKRVKDVFLNYYFTCSYSKMKTKWVDQFTEGLKKMWCTSSRIYPHI